MGRPSRLVGRLGRVVRWPCFLCIEYRHPNRWEDLYKREAIARDILISIRALPPNNMQPTAKRRLIEVLVGRLRRRGKRNQTILAAKEKNPLRWRTGKVRIYDALPVSMSCRPLRRLLDANLSKSGINYLDIFRLNTFRISAAIRTVADWARYKNNNYNNNNNSEKE